MRASTHKITLPFCHMVLWDHWTNSNYYNSSTRVAIATKLWWMVTWFNGLLPKNSHECFITWSSDITWQTKSIISPLPQCLWKPNWLRWWLIWRVYKPESQIVLWSHGLARSRDKWKPLYLHYQSAYGNQTW